MSNENNQTKPSEENANNASQKKEEDFDFKQLIAPILSSLASLGGSYMLWIKPLQNALEAFEKRMSEQDERIRRLEKKLRRYEENLGEEEEQRTLHGIETGKRFKKTHRRYPVLIE